MILPRDFFIRCENLCQHVSRLHKDAFDGQWRGAVAEEVNSLLTSLENAHEALTGACDLLDIICQNEPTDA